MNYLAHAYFSFGDEQILVGNMISDFVKGKKKFDYPIGIQKGIALHRGIDTFTDEHIATRHAKQFFKGTVGLYSGAFVDVVYDHFLAMHPDYWNEHTLDKFAENVYTSLAQNESNLPERFRKMFAYMRSQNWLYNYQFRWGIERSFEGLTRRALYLHESGPAFIAFEQHYQQLQVLANSFLHDVKNFASAEYRRAEKS